MSHQPNAYRLLDQMREQGAISDEVHATIAQLLAQERAQGYAAGADVMSGRFSAKMLTASAESHAH
ncbi:MULTISPECIES: hypothetical protein [Jeongeupia]|uniref:DUF305 domain-containing protein n=2 Tax=Jeongeupia TaxID=885864 RepID=A0ABS2BMS6_9NEIS|nr:MULTISPECIES: hypothetical protein [Jeongeupia]MBM3116735.1 hypothetical protein [Jeongeupia naejangsanensis]GHD65811.1 hypothetical protein GCM10007350_26880 [Jeongeupia chitinilytica]